MLTTFDSWLHEVSGVSTHRAVISPSVHYGVVGMQLLILLPELPGGPVGNPKQSPLRGIVGGRRGETKDISQA